MTPSIRLQVENDARIAIARCGPLAADPVDALARQSRLLAPAKLVRGDDGACELRAEVLRSGRVDAGKLARNALDAARAWLAGETPAVADPAADAERISERVACGLDELPRAWAWEPAERGGFHVHATAFGESVRLDVEAVAGGARVAARSALPEPDAAGAAALVRFAIEANRRLRLARVGLEAAPGVSTPVVWEVVIPSGADLESDLPTAVEAVVRAHAASRRPLRALRHRGVAQVYLDTRSGAPGRRPAQSRVRTTGLTAGS